MKDWTEKSRDCDNPYVRAALWWILAISRFGLFVVVLLMWGVGILTLPSMP